MPQNERMQLFEDQPVRTAWDEEQEEWHFLVVRTAKVLNEQPVDLPALLCYTYYKDYSNSFYLCPEGRCTYVYEV